MSTGIAFSNECVGRWNIMALRHQAAATVLAIPVIGVIGNSVPTSERGKQVLAEWRRLVATEAKRARGPVRVGPHRHYAVCVGFSFCPRAHGNQALDIENFVKPTVDALAAGLFCDGEQDPACIAKYDYDDSNFVFMLLQRLPDAGHEASEGAALFVSMSC